MKEHEQFIKRAIKYLGCDTARISSYRTLFLIIGFNKNTKTDGKAGQWVKNGKPYDFDYVDEHVIASGKDLKELWESVKFYHRLQNLKELKKIFIRRQGGMMAEIFLTFDMKENVFKIETWNRGIKNTALIKEVGADGNEVYVRFEEEQIIPLIKLLVANL